jgi:hypothetical protein
MHRGNTTFWIFAKTDLKMVIGLVDPHQFVGFTDGSKGFEPEWTNRIVGNALDKLFAMGAPPAASVRPARSPVLRWSGSAARPTP